jgi:tryptophan-rich sensory protein
MRPILTFLPFLIVVLGGGITIGVLTAPAEWYAALNKPPFNPPGWVFGPVWTVLYVMIAVVGWRLWRLGNAGLWAVQLELNFLWSPVFFAAQMPWAALVVILALLVVILLLIGRNWHRDRLSAWLLMPYAAWVGFATVLNASIAVLN